LSVLLLETSILMNVFIIPSYCPPC
jgi:hypothetical protein